MKRTRLASIVVVLIFLAAAALMWRLRSPRDPQSTPTPTSAAAPAQLAAKLSAVGPRLVSNQTSQPLALYGEGFAPGMSLQIGPPFEQKLPLAIVDARHAYVRLPAATTAPADALQFEVPLRLIGPGGEDASNEVMLTVVNDAAFTDLTSMVVSQRRGRVFVASAPTDELFAIDPAEGFVQRLTAGDGPSALGLWIDRQGIEWVVVAHAFAPQLRLYAVDNPGRAPLIVEAPSYAAGLSIDQQRNVAFVAEHARDRVVAIDLQAKRELWSAAAPPNPRELSFVGADRLAVGSLQTGEVALLDRATGKSLSLIAPTPATSIVGGGTDDYERYIMGGKAPRALAWSERLQRLFVASIGPNIGPNPDRMEVSMNGGVGVIDPATGAFVRHLGFGAGVTDALALDDEAGVLYAADTAIGVVRVLDAKLLVASDKSAAKALLRTVPLSPPAGFPTVRPAADFGVKGRAGVELHSGPTAVALTGDRTALHVLNRFTGVVSTLATSELVPPRTGARLASQSGSAPTGSTAATSVQVADTLGQRTRRLGQILYYADLGRTAMSCDACHPDGHTEGVFFAKTHPLRIYRTPTVRGARDSAPYFTPASTRSLAETAIEVGGRNRFHNPDPSRDEVQALAQFTASLTLLPNPFVGADGAPVTKLELPDGRVGDARKGLPLFEARCSSCHPAPHFTTDQDPATRGQFLDVGTPHALPLRVEQQELRFKKFAPPSLLGAWDVFPMLGTGSAGYEVTPEGTLRTSHPFALGEVLEKYSGPQHGDAASLTEQERADLAAYVMSL